MFLARTRLEISEKDELLERVEPNVILANSCLTITGEAFFVLKIDINLISINQYIIIVIYVLLYCLFWLDVRQYYTQLH